MLAAAPVKVALVGLGWWGKKMAALLQKTGGEIEVSCMADPDPAAARFAAQFGSQWYPDARIALAHPGVEAVVLATPHSLHGEQIRLAVAAQKHIFCEKPLALTRKDAEAATQACNTNQLVLGMGHERRWDPPVAGMLEGARKGHFGRLLQAEGNFSHDKFLNLDADNWRLNAAEAPVAGMTATGIHLTDLATALLGAAKDVRVACETLGSSLPQGDTMSAHIRFRAGGTAYISATLATPFISRFALYGTKGWIDIRDKSHVELPSGWVVTSAVKGGDISVVEVPPTESVRDNLIAFARAIRGRAPYPITTDELVENISILEAIIKSSAQEGAVVPV
jgi:predicted dehydrogenase